MFKKGLLCLLGLVALAGWGTLGMLIARTAPESFVARLLFFALLFASGFFTSASAACYLSLRIAGSQWREGEFRAIMLLGLPPAAALAVAMWLQSLRALGLASGIILLGIVVVMELAVVATSRRNRDIRRIQEVGH